MVQGVSTNAYLDMTLNYEKGGWPLGELGRDAEELSPEGHTQAPWPCPGNGKPPALTWPEAEACHILSCLYKAYNTLPAPQNTLPQFSPTPILQSQLLLPLNSLPPHPQAILDTRLQHISSGEHV